MSSSNTFRFFVNNKRVSTAVKVKNGNFLQVYPKKQWFPTQDHWQTFWEDTSKPMIHVEVPLKPEPVARIVRRQKQPTAVKESDWRFQELVTKLTVPAGKYYIGDLCYVLSDPIYETIFGKLGFWESGHYVEKEHPENFFFLNHTAYGDGTYPASDGNSFSVDAGIIGICPVSMMDKDDGGGRVYTFKNSVDCHFNNGVFLFKEKDTKKFLLKIDTT